MAPRLLPLAAALALLTAGCLSGEEAAPAAEGEEPVDALTLTSPGDLSYLNETGKEGVGKGERPHYHDYWGGKSRLLILDEERDAGGYSCGGCSGGWAMVRFRPEPNHVVPMGTGNLTVTMGWKAEEITGIPILYVKTAADPEARPVGPVENGVPVRVPSTNDHNDPPHQVLSLWEFWFGMKGKDSSGDFDFRGRVSMEVEAERSLPIPIYPAHPDLWDGATEKKVLQASQRVGLMYETDGSTSCSGGCLATHTLDDGMIVPFDADELVVTLTVEPGVPTLGLVYHGADSWEFAPANGTTEGLTTTFRVPIDPAKADSPYAKQSLWTFDVYNAQTTPVKVFSGTYTITATAYKTE